MPNCVAVTALFWKRLLSLRLPRLPVPMVLLPKPMPISVVIELLPATLRFLIVLLVAGSLAPID